MTDSENINATIQRLYNTIVSRRGGDPASSYTAKLFDGGNERIAQKLGEEAVEAVIATVAKDRNGMICESADLLYHLLVAWAYVGIAPEDVLAELDRRDGISGVEEKESRGEV